MVTPSDLRVSGAVIRFDASIFETMEPGLFGPDWLRSNGLWQGSTQGRNHAHFFKYAGRDMVLRHFHRGGLVGRVNSDLYLRAGASKSRAFREFDLLQAMRSKGLPVPRPLAARYVPTGLFYRADIITERVADARPLQDILRDRSLSAPLWRAVGRTVRDMHDRNVFHSDLNCRNIMLDANDGVWLIDFDKCERRQPGPWTQSNLDRLLRSLRKTATMHTDLNWVEADWADLLAGYGEGTGRP